MLLLDVAAAGLRISAPLVFAAVGETFSQKAGVINVQLEGMMLVGAYTGVTAAISSGDPLIGLLAAIAGGILLALVHGFVCITLGGNQIVSGIALNLFALGMTSFLLDIFFEEERARAPGLEPLAIPGLSDIPGLGRVLFNQSLGVYLMLVLIPLGFFVLYKTPWGLRVLACGENPRAADTVGANVKAVRYQALILAGGLAGLGGGVLALSQLRFFVDNLTAGRGFIALAAVLFANWRPVQAALAASLFGFADALQLRLQAIGIGIPPEALTMLPFVLTLIVLGGFVGRARPPRYFGVPYVRGQD
jgi:ABC-type uncharacterized transport system permease subunit